MGPPAVTMLLVVVLVFTATLPHAWGSSDPDKDQDSQCSPLEKRQNLLENRLNERDSDLDKQLNAVHTQMNSLDARLSQEFSSLDQRLTTQLNTLQNEVNTRLNRMDSRLDGLEIAIADMKDYLQSQLNAMDKKVDEASGGCEPQQNVTEEPQETVYRGCEDVLAHGLKTSGVYTISPDGYHSFDVYCEQELNGGGWTVFQARKNGTVDFNEDWNTYKTGFGQLTAEFWLGNDIIHSLTKHHDQQMQIELESTEGEVKYANYAKFWIDDEASKYELTATEYSGGDPPGNSLRTNTGEKFTTKDQDNDDFGRSCSDEYMGAWWYSSGCGYSNLNGVYGSSAQGKGVNWGTWHGFAVSLKTTRMMFKKSPK